MVFNHREIQVCFNLKSTVFQSLMFDSLMWSFICYGLFHHSENILIITFVHKPNGKGVLLYRDFPRNNKVIFLHLIIYALTPEELRKRNSLYDTGPILPSTID